MYAAREAGPLRNVEISPEDEKDGGYPKLHTCKEHQFFHGFLRLLPHQRNCGFKFRNHLYPDF